jgi:hypothetical protein
VHPGEWPGVACAVRLTGPSVTTSPSRTARSTRTAGNFSSATFSLEQRLVGRAGNQLRACLFLQLGEAAGVIEMRVRVQDELDIRKLEPKLLDVCPDLPRRFRHRRVHQDVSVRAGDQI